LRNSLELIEWCKSGKKPKDIPYQPFIVYKRSAEDSGLRHGAGQLEAASAHGWKGMSDWLGTGGKPNAKKGEGKK
jgi:hypothetical protein